MLDPQGHIALGRHVLPVTSEQIPTGFSRKIAWFQQHVACDVVLAFADRHRRILFLTVLVFYLAAFNGQWRIQPDAALYLSLGRNLAEGKGYTYLGEVNRLAYPGWPVLIAVTFKIFGTKSLIYVNALMTLIALATLAMVYRLFLLYADRPTAVVITVGVGLTKAFFCYGFELWSDMPFAFGAMSVLAGYEGVFCKTRDSSRKTFIDWICLLGGLLIAASMRPTVFALLAALTLAIIVQTLRREIKWRMFLSLGAIALVVLGIVAIVGRLRADLHGFGGVYTDYLLNRLSDKSFDAADHPFIANITDLFNWAASDVLFQVRFGPVWNSLLSLLVLGLGVGLFRYRVIWGCWFCILLSTILLSQRSLDRYFLPVAPLLVFAWWELLVRLNRAFPPRWSNLVFLVLLCFGATSNICKVGGIIAQQREQPFLANYDRGSQDASPQFSSMLQARLGDRAIILSKPLYARVTAFLSDRHVTRAWATTADDLQTHPVYVIEPSDLLTQEILRKAGLVEGPALFTVPPSPTHGPLAAEMSLHSTPF